MDRRKRRSSLHAENGHLANDGKHLKRAVLDQLGISLRDLRGWRTEPPPSLHVVSLRLSKVEVSRRPVYLRRQIAKMAAERDAVKRALAILARGRSNGGRVDAAALRTRFP
jgi:hypothetical protein